MQGSLRDADRILHPAWLLYTSSHRSVIGANWSQLRLLANEDTSVGLWMLAANVTYFEDMRLCSPTCT